MSSYVRTRVLVRLIRFVALIGPAALGLAAEKTPGLQLGVPLLKPKSAPSTVAAGLGGQTLTLAQAIERAIAHNRTIQTARITLKGQEITYKNAFDTMFIPQISLQLNSNSNLTLANIPGAVTNAVGSSQNSHGYPVTSFAGLQLANYHIFNFWKDWLLYQPALLDWKRQQEVFNETVRAQRVSVTQIFFTYSKELEKLEAAQRSIQISDAVSDVVKSRLHAHRAGTSDNDIASSAVDLLNAKIQYEQQYVTTKSALWALNNALGDPVDTQYSISDQLKYIPLKILASDALRIYFESSPNMKDRREAIKKAELAVDLAEKARLPLPTIELSQINLGFSNNWYGSGNQVFTNGPGNANFDIMGAITFSVPITGVGGLFGGRTVDTAQFALDQQQLSYEVTGTNDQISIYQGVATIAQLEKTIDHNREAFEKSAALLDGLFANVTKANVNRLELRDALTQSRGFEFALEDSVVNHLQQKLQLAVLIGVDHLPGDPY